MLHDWWGPLLISNPEISKTRGLRLVWYAKTRGLRLVLTEEGWYSVAFGFIEYRSPLHHTWCFHSHIPRRKKDNRVSVQTHQDGTAEAMLEHDFPIQIHRRWKRTNISETQQHNIWSYAFLWQTKFSTNVIKNFRTSRKWTNQKQRQ